MHYRSQGVTLFGSGRRAQRRDLEGIEEEVRALRESVAALADKLGDIHELLSDVVLEDRERRHFLSEHGQALGTTSTGDAKGLS